MQLSEHKNIHFTGIGGIGMSAIASLLLARGYAVSGSDLEENEQTGMLQQQGAIIYRGHNRSYINDADLLVYSSAVAAENPELREARQRGIALMKRAELLGLLLQGNWSVAIAGTHGKTTTSSLIGAVLMAGRMDPTLLIGGVMRGLQSNARCGATDCLVVEADEYDRSFLHLAPTIAVITNIEMEHLDCYRSYPDLLDGFSRFANAVPLNSRTVVCLDDAGVRDLLPSIERKVVSYGLQSDADITAGALQLQDGSSCFDVYRSGLALGRVMLPLPGRHNVLNALAAIAVGLEAGVAFADIALGLRNFSGVGRRFEIRDLIGDIMVVDDYGHHPTEILSTLRAARENWPGRQVIAIFQPHLYSRTRDFYREFALVLAEADRVYVTDIYPAREAALPGVSAAMICRAAEQAGVSTIVYRPDMALLAAEVAPLLVEGDLLITLGAGDIWKCAEAIAASLRKDRSAAAMEERL